MLHTSIVLMNICDYTCTLKDMLWCYVSRLKYEDKYQKHLGNFTPSILLALEVNPRPRLSQVTPNWNCLKQPSLQITNADTALSGTVRSSQESKKMVEVEDFVKVEHDLQDSNTKTRRSWKVLECGFFDNTGWKHGSHWQHMPFFECPSEAQPACCFSDHPPIWAQSRPTAHRQWQLPWNMLMWKCQVHQCDWQPMMDDTLIQMKQIISLNHRERVPRDVPPCCPDRKQWCNLDSWQTGQLFKNRWAWTLNQKKCQQVLVLKIPGEMNRIFLTWGISNQRK